MLSGGFDIYPLPGPYEGSKPSIVAGPGGASWSEGIYFVDGSGDLGFADRDGAVSFPVQASATAGGVGGVTRSPDASVYYTQGSSIGLIRPGASGLTPIPNGLNAYAITTDPRGDLWYVQDSSVVGESRTDGTFASITLPGGGPTNFATEESIVPGADGNIWVTRLTSASGNTIDRITPDGSVTEFVISHDFDTRIGLAGAPDGPLYGGPDGNVWFADYGAGQVGKITPDGTITRYDVGGRPSSITAGADGAYWFTMDVTDPTAAGYPGVIGRITPDGTITGEYAPDAGTHEVALAGPDGITTGSDGALWFTEVSGDAVGRLDPSVAGSPPPTSSLVQIVPVVLHSDTPAPTPPVVSPPDPGTAPPSDTGTVIDLGGNFTAIGYTGPIMPVTMTPVASNPVVPVIVNPGPVVPIPIVPVTTPPVAFNPVVPVIVHPGPVVPVTAVPVASKPKTPRPKTATPTRPTPTIPAWLSRSPDLWTSVLGRAVPTATETAATHRVHPAPVRKVAKAVHTLQRSRE